MIFTRDQVRESAFLAVGLGDAERVAPQWLPIAIFVVLLMAAVATIGWMLTALVRGRRRAGDGYVPRVTAGTRAQALSL